MHLADSYDSLNICENPNSFYYSSSRILSSSSDDSENKIIISSDCDDSSSHGSCDSCSNKNHFEKEQKNVLSTVFSPAPSKPSKSIEETNIILPFSTSLRSNNFSDLSEFKSINSSTNPRSSSKDFFPLCYYMNPNSYLPFHLLSNFCHYNFPVSPIRSITTHPCLPYLISTSDEGCISVWNIKHPSLNAIPQYTLGDHSGPILTSTFMSKTNRFITAGMDRKIHIWDLSFTDQSNYDESISSNKLKHVLYGHNDSIFSLASHPNNSILVSCSTDQNVFLWNLSDSFDTFDSEPYLCDYLTTSSQSPAGMISIIPTSVCYASTNSFSFGVGMNNGDLSLVDLMQQVSTFTYSSSIKNDAIFKMCSHPDMSLFLTGNKSGSLCFYDTRDCHVATQWKAHNDSISSMVIPDGYNVCVTSSYDGSLRVWDLKQRTCIQELNDIHDTMYDESITSIAYSVSTGTLITAGVDQMLSFFNLH
ncbi:hypothetical protein WA158_005094 [Blastocystis sp. Blastoise]